MVATWFAAAIVNYPDWHSFGVFAEMMTWDVVHRSCGMGGINLLNESSAFCSSSGVLRSQCTNVLVRHSHTLNCLVRCYGYLSRGTWQHRSH